MKESLNYINHLLASNERDKFRAEVNENHTQHKKVIDNYLSSLPSDEWIDFIGATAPTKIPLLIKLICLYMYDKWKPNDSFDFNNDVTLIRRRKYDYTQIQDTSCFDFGKKGRRKAT